MSQELTINGSIAYDDGVSQDSLDIANLVATIGTQEFTHLIQSIDTSETAINLGGISTPGWMFVKNLDPTNYVKILTGTGGLAFARVGPGQSHGPSQCGPDVTAPFAIADTAPCRIEYFVAAQ